MKVVMFWFDVDDFTLHWTMVRRGQPLNSVKPDHHPTILFVQPRNITHNLQTRRPDTRFANATISTYNMSTDSFILVVLFALLVIASSIIHAMALVCSLLDAREEKHSLERQQKEFENNKVLLAIRQAEARKLELELEHSKALLAIKQADLESNKDLVAMEETDVQENLDGSDWETNMG